MMGFLSKYSERSTKIRMILLSMAGDWAGKIYDLFQKMNIAKIIMGALGVGDSTMSSISKSLINFSVSASEIFQGLGLALALLFFLIAMLELITQDRFNLEFFIKFFEFKRHFLFFFAIIVFRQGGQYYVFYASNY